MKTKQIAETFHVSPSWARRVKQRRRETGETTHRRMGSPGVTIVDREQLASLVHEHPDATLAELRTLLGVECALSTLCQALKQLGLSFKKKRSMRRSKIARTSCNGGLNGGRGRRKRTRGD
jgi:transposase